MRYTADTTQTKSSRPTSRRSAPIDQGVLAGIVGAGQLEGAFAERCDGVQAEAAADAGLEVKQRSSGDAGLCQEAQVAAMDAISRGGELVP